MADEQPQLQLIGAGSKGESSLEVADPAAEEAEIKAGGW